MVTMRRLSVKAIMQASEKIHTYQTLPACQDFLTPQTALWGDFPFQQLFSSSSNHNQLKDWDLTCCHSSLA